MVHLIFAVVFSFNLSAAIIETDFERSLQKISKSKIADHEKLQQLFKVTWDHNMAEYPEWATYLGVRGQDHRWTDISLAAIARREVETLAVKKTLDTISPKKLSPEDQLNYSIFKYQLERTINGFPFPGHLLPIGPLEGVQQDLTRVLVIMPKVKREHFQNILARMKKIPEVIDQTLALLAQGLKNGVTNPKIIMRDVPQQVKNQIVSDPLKSSFLIPFVDNHAEVPEAEMAALKAEAAKVYKEKVVPAFQKLHDYLVNVYLPGARETIALSSLPNGPAWYRHRIQSNTTTDKTAEEIHELGKSEVARIRQEMHKVMKEVKFKGDLQAFFNHLRTNPRFFYKRPDDLLQGYRDIAKRIDPELPRFFGTLPRLPYGITPIPSYAEKSQTTAYYEGGSVEAARAGYFFANTYDLKSRPKWEMEALTLHEAVPGHHLQIALAQEQVDLPDFRRHGGFTAFVEGWGLYAEGLGYEMGLYKDPYSRFGQLTYEMWRAIRLVVDTGMHALGWSRQQAIDYFIENAGKTGHDITVEVDRYIGWPGQALAYKIGQLKIKELRDNAKSRLGDKFDIRKFHDVVLGGGALPLSVLESRVENWVEAPRRR